MEADNDMIRAPLIRRIKLAIMQKFFRFTLKNNDCLRFWHNGCWNTVYLNIKKMSKMSAAKREKIYSGYHEIDREELRNFLESFIDSYIKAGHKSGA